MKHFVFAGFLLLIPLAPGGEQKHAALLTWPSEQLTGDRTGAPLEGENELAMAASILCFLIMPATERPLFIPVILGTPRQGRRSEHPAHLVLKETKKRAGVETELIDVRSLHMRLDDAGEEMKDPAFSATVERADALILIVPEYNHGYPGLLKHALDMNLKEYIHKAVGLCGVSAGPFGGARVIEHLLPVMRELGLVTTFTDVNFSNVKKLFNENGELLDESFVCRVNEFLDELLWMACVLRHGRENIAPQ